MTQPNANARLEALFDGVFAIAMTLLVIEIRLPPTEHIAGVPELWRALQHLAPIIFAFVLSFVVILITWFNHRATMMLVHRSSSAFIYANGFLLLTVASLPFPTALLGEFVLTDTAAPAVVLYNAVLAAQALGWILLTGAALKDNLVRDEESAARIRENRRNGYFALVLYGLLAIIALWLPVTVAIVTTASWIFWLALGLRMKSA